MTPTLAVRSDAENHERLAADGTAGDAAAEQAILRAARLAADSGDLEAADALCSQMLSRDAACAEAHYLLGVVRQAQGAMDAAQRSFEKALYLHPGHYEAMVHLMLLAEQHGDQPAAANYRRRARQAALREATR